MKKQMARDEHGYINERGASKYWGVTTSKVDGKRIWVINFKVGGVTHGFRASGFVLKEVDAARLAAWLYEKGDQAINTRDRIAYILTADKKYVIKIDLDDTYFYREKATNQKVYQFQPNLTLPLDDEPKPVVKSLGPVDNYRSASLYESVNASLRKEEPVVKEGGVSLDIDELSKALKDLEEVVPSERELLSLITDAVLNKSVSKQSARIMISILEQAV